MSPVLPPGAESAQLATACPACTTVFRVVQDQLKVSQGWVRCGRCHEVFNALEALFDLDAYREASAQEAAADQAAEVGRDVVGSGVDSPLVASTGPSAAPTPAPPSASQTESPAPSGPTGPADPDIRRGPLAAAAALRDRFSARNGASSSAAATSSRGRGGVFVQEAPMDEAEMDTRFEPKIFDDESARLRREAELLAAAQVAPASMDLLVNAQDVARAEALAPSAAQVRVNADAPASPDGSAAELPVAARPSLRLRRGRRYQQAPGGNAGTAAAAEGEGQDGAIPGDRSGEAREPVPAGLSTGAAAAHRHEPWLEAPAATLSESPGRGASSVPSNPADDEAAWGETVVDDPADLRPPAGASDGPPGSAAAAAGSIGLSLSAIPPLDGGGGPAPGGLHVAAAGSDQALAAAVAHAVQHGMAEASAHVSGPLTQPGFLRDAERKARWQRPWVRASLALVCVLLVLAAGLQLGYSQRDRYAARWPVLRPGLELLCEGLDCSIQPPRLLDALVVETSSLTRPPGVEGLRLQVVLRNRVDHEVAAPHVEMTLNDAAGAVAARRVFSPAEFGISRPALLAQQDANWSLVFATPLRNVAGYTVAVFYP